MGKERSNRHIHSLILGKASRIPVAFRPRIGRFTAATSSESAFSPDVGMPKTRSGFLIDEDVFHVD